MTPVRHTDDNDYAAPVVRVETITVVSTPAGERVLATEVWPTDRPPLAREIDWPPNATFQYRGYHFHVPEGVMRAVDERDSDDDLVRTAFFDQAAKVVSTVAVERDEYGRITQIVQTNDGDIFAEVRFAYDDTRRQISTTVSLRGIVVSSKVTTLSEQGLAASDEETSLDGRMRRVLYKYTFNERGDWTERVASTDSGGATITRRQITYED